MFSFGLGFLSLVSTVHRPIYIFLSLHEKLFMNRKNWLDPQAPYPFITSHTHKLNSRGLRVRRGVEKRQL